MIFNFHTVPGSLAPASNPLHHRGAYSGLWEGSFGKTRPMSTWVLDTRECAVESSSSSECSQMWFSDHRLSKPVALRSGHEEHNLFLEKSWRHQPCQGHRLGSKPEAVLSSN